MSDSQGKKGGFFRRLFGRKKKAQAAPEAGRPPEAPSAAEAKMPPAAPGTMKEAPSEASSETPSEAKTPAAERGEAEPAAPAPEEAAPAAPASMTPPVEEVPAEGGEEGRRAEEKVEAPAAREKAEEAPAPEEAKEAPAPEEAGETPAEEKASGWLASLRKGLAKSSSALSGGISGIFSRRKLDAEALQDLEDILIQADLGVDMAERVIARIGGRRHEKGISPDEVRAILADEVARVLKPVEKPFEIDPERRPFVVLVVGVNGSGKTTTIGKLAAIARDEGHSVMLVAADTFRAAAVEQLGVWAQRSGARFMSRPTGADPAALAFDAMREARERGTDIVFIDTAGRLQNKKGLMEELAKIVRVLKKTDETAPHAVLLALDATTGQNAMNQVEVFREVAGVTGLVMTKLDGTARGGILAAIAEKHKLPVHAIGVGEGVSDLQPFDAEAFAAAIAGVERKIA